MNRRTFLSKSVQFLAFSAFLPEATALALSEAEKATTASASAQTGAAGHAPNIVLIVADDLGYAELGVQGAKDLRSPHIDSIAKNGIRFTNGYVSCPVCSPSRAGFMTGRYQERFGHELNPGPPSVASEKFGLPLSETTMASRLKQLGYTTGIFGKWHLGSDPEFHPFKRGFDEFYGFMAGAHSYIDVGQGTNAIMDGTKPVGNIQYTTDTFGRKAVDFIDRHADKPFFLYLPFNAVHSPLQALPKYLERFSSIQDRKRRTFAAMLAAMDDAVGGVLEKLREKKLEENTLVFFISDNGGPTQSTTSSNAPLRGYKGQVLEGGIRVPFLVQWKGHLPAGKVYDKPVISLDILPTVLTAVHGKITPEMKLDGVNLLPYLQGKDQATPHDKLYWRFGEQAAMRSGDWKLVLAAPGAPAQLYNLAQDIGESNDLAAKNPEKLKELQTAYDAWNAQLMPPRWKRERPNKKNKKQKRAQKRAAATTGSATETTEPKARKRKGRKSL